MLIGKKLNLPKRQLPFFQKKGKYLRLKKRICWSEFFCREFEEVTYSPTFFQRLKVTLSTILISVCIGLLIGISF
ncbi:hypothetical protein LEP1GSC024_2289 [Leptospira noguchii str. 2001034031]|uniref:Uncharacterized protein n=1 Tax=Leptospira noguchii str. 2001034031 TaxID=1193053 RepID=M6Y6S6_9LEPT|nr:hypothetical protein LEP1GSC024_2289 [Leptospira noguchii str. 2001034031]